MQIKKISIKEKLSNIRIEKNAYHIFIFPIVFVYFEVLLRILGKTGVFHHLIYPIIFGIGAGLLISCITSVFSSKVNWIISLILLFLTGTIYITECLIYRSMQFYMPLDAIGSIADDVTGGYAQQVVQTVLFSIPIVVIYFWPAISYLIWGKRFAPAQQQTVKISGVLLAGAVLFTGIGACLAGSGDTASKYKSQYKFDTATQYFGLISSLQLEFFYGLFGNEAADAFVIMTDGISDEQSSGDEAEVSDNDNAATDMAEITEIPEVTEKVYAKNEMNLLLDEISASTSDETLIAMNEYVKSIPSSSQNEYTGIFKGKNLILICAEAFSHAAIDEQLTPTLYRLTHNGFYFSEFYQPYWGGSTSSGEYSMLMGIAPLRDIRTLPDTQGKNLYFTMGNQLHRLGYTGNAYHNGGYKYYSRNLTHQNLGYDEYIAQGSGLEDIASAWPTDLEMLSSTLPTYINNQPFSVYYMTVTGHFPYKMDNYVTTKNIEYVRSIAGDKYKDKTLAYLCYQVELEYALASVVEQLEAAGIANDTVICITSDHYPYGLKHSSTYSNSEDYLEDLYGYYPQNEWEQDRNAWILWSGSLENEHKNLVCEISDPTYSLDILPTLSNLFGLEYDSRLLVGRDVFSDAEPLALWTNHSWVTKEGKYDADNGTFYPNEGSVAGDEYVQQINNIVANKLSFSDKVLSYDYYDILFGDTNE